MLRGLHACESYSALAEVQLKAVEPSTVVVEFDVKGLQKSLDVQFDTGVWLAMESTADMLSTLSSYQFVGVMRGFLRLQATLGERSVRAYGNTQFAYQFLLCAWRLLY